MFKSPAPRLNRGAALGLLCGAALFLSGCAFLPASAEDRASAVVTEFFDLLESGDTENILPLLAENSPLRAGDSELLDSDFYADAIARPTEATVVMSGQYKPGLIYVTVDYLLGDGGEARTMKVAVVEEDGQSQISSWRREDLTIPEVKAPGVFEINGSYRTPPLSKVQTVVALPGIYTFEYVDPDGWGTLDPDGQKTEPFDIEFPVEGAQLAANIPAGVTSTSGQITPSPRLTKKATTTVTNELADMRTNCAEQNLTGDACPDPIIAQVNADGGAPDAGSVTWQDYTVELIVPGGEWRFAARYRIHFTRGGMNSSVTVDVTGALVPDSHGEPTLAFDDAG
ncbi:hypothetical protein GCM10022198_16510 [Klugiella xanthotipulae]|uniref:Uncharacterized protein n=1 Tax=Klugiella xanthotipulae TaxID=244735 RepID=A0A543HHC2_9MICO|nr:hypothetical protein [Klugiella xanthotipulae]TQM57687.1 hypothetical protein FB466_2683 [Klugiella xanthotipulae]